MNKLRFHVRLREKVNLSTSVWCFVLSLFIFSITIFSSGCGNGFKRIMDEPLGETTLKTVTGINLNKTTSTINVGGYVQLYPTITPSNATNQDVTWSSDAAGIATVSPDGLVSGVAVGNTAISVTTADGDHTATCAVTVSTVPVAVTEVNLNATTSSINVGGTVQLTPTISPPDATNQNVTWSSNATGYATVSSSGLVSGVAAGNATITVTTVDGNHTATCAVTVSTATVAVTGVNLNATTSSINVGGTVQLTPTISPPDATNQNVTWSSNATGYATVSSSGLVTGVAAGNATITVTTADGNLTSTCAVTVSTATVAVTGVNLNATTSSINVGGTVQLTPTISPPDATNQNVTWSSNATGYATVSSSGLVSGIAAGNATITVRTVDGNFTATCAVTVSVATVPVTGVSLNLTSSTRYIGETVQLTPTITPSNATNQNVTWSSSATGYATVSSSGLVSGVALGSATITVRTVDGNFTATCNMTVANVIFWTETDKTINRIYTNTYRRNESSYSFWHSAGYCT